MKVLPVAVNFIVGKGIHHFHIACKNNALIIGNGDMEFDLAIPYNPAVPVANGFNANSLRVALSHMVQVLSTHTKNISEENQKSIVSYIHGRVVKVSNNLFEVPLRGDEFKPQLVLATTVAARPINYASLVSLR